MLGVATVLTASALTPVAVPYDVQRRMSSSYPAWALRDRRSAGAVLEAIVEPDGKVRECKVVAFIGSERLATEECANLQRRKLKPAVDANGQPTLGLFRTQWGRRLAGRSGNDEAEAVRRWVQPTDLSVEVSDWSSEARRVDVGVVLLVKADGSVAACADIAEPKNEIPATFVDAACVEAKKQTMTVLSGADGQPSDYVANVTVRFVAAPAG
jgi:hypothetical protein